MAEKYELAYADYKAGMKQKEIAAKYDVSINTVKSWQQRKWKEMDATGANEKVCTPKQEGMHTENNDTEKQYTPTENVIEEDGIELDEYDLTPKQRRFVEEYLKTFNATSAYKKAYKCQYSTAMVEGSKSLRKPKISEAIDKIKAERLEMSQIEGVDLLMMYKKIAFADMTDFIDFEQVESEVEIENVTYDEAGNEQREVRREPFTYTKFAMHHSDEVDGTLITELARGPDGVFKVKLADKMAALAFLSKYANLLNERELQLLKTEQARLNINKTKSDIEIKNKELAILNESDKDKNITINFVRKGDT